MLLFMVGMVGWLVGVTPHHATTADHHRGPATTNCRLQHHPLPPPARQHPTNDQSIHQTQSPTFLNFLLRNLPEKCPTGVFQHTTPRHTADHHHRPGITPRHTTPRPPTTTAGPPPPTGASSTTHYCLPPASHHPTTNPSTRPSHQLFLTSC